MPRRTTCPHLGGYTGSWLEVPSAICPSGGGAHTACASACGPGSRHMLRKEKSKTRFARRSKRVVPERRGKVEFTPPDSGSQLLNVDRRGIERARRKRLSYNPGVHHSKQTKG